MTNPAPAVTTAQGPVPVPDLEPFKIDPLFLGRLAGRRVKPVTVAIASAVIAAIATTWAASVQDQLYRPAGADHWWTDFPHFVLRRSAKGAAEINLFSDYPSILLGVAITASIGLVYHLFVNAGKLHSSMDEMQCLTFPDAASRQNLATAVDQVNKRFERVGHWAPATFIACLALVAGVNLLLIPGGLYGFLGSGNRYEGWWAALHPFHGASLVWIAMGAFGVYAVYIEAVLGLSYVSFLRNCGSDYRFRPNIFNPDQFYGWLVLRKLISNMEAGVICTFLACFALSYFLPSAVGAVISVGVLLVFAGVVLYVFAMVTLNFRRQVKYDKLQETMRISTSISADEKLGTVDAELRIHNGYKRLELLQRVPNSPLRAAWLVAGAVTVLIPIIVVSFQAASYLAPPK